MLSPCISLRHFVYLTIVIFTDLIQKLHQFSADLIRERRSMLKNGKVTPTATKQNRQYINSAAIGQDCLSLFLADGMSDKFTDQQLTDIIMSLLIAGASTSVSTTLWSDTEPVLHHYCDALTKFKN